MRTRGTTTPRAQPCVRRRCRRVPTRGAFQMQEWYRVHASGCSDGGGQTTQMIIGKRRSGGTRHQKARRQWRHGMRLALARRRARCIVPVPFSVFFSAQELFFSHAFLGRVAVVEHSSCKGDVEKSGRPYEETSTSLIVFELVRKTTDQQKSVCCRPLCNVAHAKFRYPLVGDVGLKIWLRVLSGKRNVVQI
jgi:hypothetical protein